jgi:hypothetical protein
MRTTWRTVMKTKLTFLLALTFLFSIFVLTSCASFPTTKIAYFKNGKEAECHQNNCQVNQDILHCNVFSETGTPPPTYTDAPSYTPSNVTRHSGTVRNQSSGSTYSYRGTSRTQNNQMQQGLNSMSNALGNMASRMQYEQRVENRYYECMKIMKGYDLVTVPIGYSNQQHAPSKTNYTDKKTSVPYGTLGVSDECNVNNLTWGGEWGSTIPRNEQCIEPNPHSK